ncbi:hypothetical protein BTVI_32392 [Pitangus sulphuratus]|nr:hypothetical protein BTVI_32392 [Pitangus sulphuratus]
MEAAGGPAACYRELSQFPAITRAALGAAAGGQTFLLYTECSRPDLPRRRLLRFSRQYSVRRTGRGLAASSTALSAGIHNQLLSQDSPTGQHRAVLSRCPRQGHELLEVWDSGGRSHSVDLTALGKHGEVYTEGPFACLAWSHSETRLLYVAEKSRPKRHPPCPWDVPGAAWPAEDEDEEGEQFLYHEDWGEALSTRSVPILCILDLDSSSLSVLEGVPEHLSPGQTRQTVTVLDVVQEPTEGEHSTVGRAGRCQGTGTLPSQMPTTPSSLAQHSAPLVAFAGLYTEVLPPRCWAADSRRAVLGTPQRSRTDLLLVDTEAATVTNLTAGGPHAVFDARWRPSMAALCRLGFAVLLVNYRGSLGFGQASISSLLSRVGEQDVADTQLAVEQALRSEPLDPHRLALLAGSHGAFIALHLLTREPERYRACALRSPISNLPALLGTSDIPDWRYTSLGLPYSFERVPRAEEVATMLLHSPIAQAAQVREDQDGCGMPGTGCQVPTRAVLQVRTPVLLCVGARDRRVSPTQALELYRVLRARGVPARLLWYPEGGHALTGVETEADVFKNCARWLLQHLGQPRQDGTGQHSP